MEGRVWCLVFVHRYGRNFDRNRRGRVSGFQQRERRCARVIPPPPPQDTHLINLRIHDLMWSKAFSIFHPLKNVSGFGGARALDLQLFARHRGFSTIHGAREVSTFHGADGFSRIHTVKTLRIMVK